MKVVAIIVFVILLLSSAFAQTTEFTYQGSLKDGVNPANGAYDFEFRLFDALSGGAQVGSLLTRPNIAVSAGIFSVTLDFGNSFPGATRFLEVRVRNAGGTGFTVLDPRQKLASSPYSVKSLSTDNAAQLGGVAANQYPLTTDPRLSDARNPLPGSANYIQNTGVQQASSSFNISGNGTSAGTLSGSVVNAGTQFNLGGSRILTVGGLLGTSLGLNAGTPASRSAFFGNSAGAIATGNNNSFFGAEAGAVNTTGGHNSFFGTLAGNDTTSGSDNSFYGALAGAVNTTGTRNAFFGAFSGQVNTTGTDNSFFGRASGPQNTVGIRNSLFGFAAGLDLESGNENTLVGFLSGDNLTTGSGNSGLGANTSYTANLTNATAIGYRASVTQNNSLVLGSINLVNNATSDTNVGIGTTAPEKKLHVRGPASVEIQIESSDAGGRKWTLQSSSGGSNGRFEIIDRTANASRMAILDDGNVGVGTTAPADKLHVNGILRLNTLGAAGATHLCRNASNQISTCSSPRPSDMGLFAEEVAEAEALLVNHSDKGEIEGVKYDRVSVVLLNAVREQQAQIKAQQKLIEELRAGLCHVSPLLDMCKGENK